MAGESQVTKLWEAPYILIGINNQKITERHRTAQAHLKSRVTRRIESHIRIGLGIIELGLVY